MASQAPKKLHLTRVGGGRIRHNKAGLQPASTTAEELLMKQVLGILTSCWVFAQQKAGLNTFLNIFRLLS